MFKGGTPIVVPAPTTKRPIYTRCEQKQGDGREDTNPALQNVASETCAVERDGHGGIPLKFNGEDLLHETCIVVKRRGSAPGPGAVSHEVLGLTGKETIGHGHQPDGLVCWHGGWGLVKHLG